MSLYECIVYDEQGNRSRKKLSFDSEKELKVYAIEKNLKIANIKLIKNKNNKNLRDKDLSVLCNQLGMLISSGCEITHSLNTIQLNCSKKLKPILKSINYNLQKGNPISLSFKNSAKFSKFFINMVKAGEVSGKLDEILMNLSDYYKKEYEFKRKLILAMVYPTALILTCICVILFTLIYTVPKFQQSFIGSESNLPLTTKVLINFSMNLRNHYKIIFLIVGAIIGLLIYMFKKEYKVRMYFDKKLFEFKLTRNIIQTIEVNKFIRCIYILISSGVQITKALDISCDVISNKYMSQKLNISKSLIQKGNSIAFSLDKSQVFPKIVISMIEVGEETGKMEHCLRNININYENNLDNLTSKIIKLIEPIIVLVLGLVIGTLLVFIMTPVFDAVTSFE